MAVNIFDKYGIKQVANVYFEALSDDPKAGVYKGDIVLFLDTLKVSTIETTAENVAAQGGWGNPRLIQWDYNKEINITLEDALISLESLRFMLGGAIKRKATENEPTIVHHTEEVVCLADGKIPEVKDHLTGKVLTPMAVTGHPIRIINLTTGSRTQIITDKATLAPNSTVTFINPSLQDEQKVTEVGDRLRIFWDEILTGSNKDVESAVEVTISPRTFPGTYKVVGDTFMRDQDGKDWPFQFIINNAKVASEVTITLEAEGDPSTFEMTLNVLRDSQHGGEGEMMKLVRYSIDDSSTGSGNDYGSITPPGS